ncbi:MAG: class I SAM-dependent methyltransferase [Acidimicrobiales bacterium]
MEINGPEGPSLGERIAREGGRRARAVAVAGRNRATTPLRRSLAAGNAGWLSRVPPVVRQALDLGGAPVSPLRVELGGGTYPTPGYVHVDQDWRALHLEHRAPVWELPFADGEVEEILAIHVLEHIAPGRLAATLAEWHRVLRPGGVAQVHVPNCPEIFAAFGKGTTEAKWLLTAALFGQHVGLEPNRGGVVADAVIHRAMFDFDLLRDTLAGAGFVGIEDLTATVSDRHTEGWSHVVPRISLVVRARRPTDQRVGSSR